MQLGISVDNKSPQSNGETVRPLLRWAGSKRSAMRHLAEHAPKQYNRYFEPFVGSGALYFHLKPDRSVLSDLNVELMNFYIHVKKSPAAVFREMSLIPREKNSYLDIRKSFNAETDTFRRAVQFSYLNRNCFNGLYRTNKAGCFNVPYAEKGRSAYPSEQDFLAASKLLSSATLLLGDFRGVINEHLSEGDFVYLDPPYLKSEGRIFSEYVAGHFSSSDLDDLQETLDIIDQRGGKFIMSFLDDPIIEYISARWNVAKYQIQRNIAGFAGARKRAPEILVKNW
jgi:DNA adenine methylase